MRRRVRIVRFDPNPAWHDEPNGARAAKLEQSIDPLVVVGAVRVVGVGGDVCLPRVDLPGFKGG